MPPGQARFRTDLEGLRGFAILLVVLFHAGVTGLPFAGSCAYRRAESISQLGIRAQDRAARGLPVSFIDMNDVICPGVVCSPIRNGEVVFTDDNHLTASFSRSVGDILGARIIAAAGR